jgi:MFS family permease
MLAIVGVFFAGGFLGSFLFAWLADKVGRKRALDAVGLMAVVAVVITAASVNIGMLLAGRIIQGIA